MILGSIVIDAYSQGSTRLTLNVKESLEEAVEPMISKVMVWTPKVGKSVDLKVYYPERMSINAVVVP